MAHEHSGSSSDIGGALMGQRARGGESGCLLFLWLWSHGDKVLPKEDWKRKGRLRQTGLLGLLQVRSRKAMNGNSIAAAR